MVTTIRHALYLMRRGDSRRWWLLLLLAIAVSLMEVLAAGLIYVLLGLVADPTGAIDLPLVGNLNELVGEMDRSTTLYWLIGIMIGFFMVRAAVLITAEYVTTKVIQTSAAQLSSDLVRGYLKMPFEFHLRHNSAELIRNTQQVTLELANSAFSPLIRVTAETVLVLGMLVLLLLVSPIGTALALLVVGGTTVLMLLVIQPRLKRFGVIAHAMHKDTLETQRQCFDGVRDIKVLDKEDHFADVYARHRSNLARTFYLRSTLANLAPVAMDTALITFILVFFVVALAAGSQAEGALAVLGLFGYAGLRLQPSLKAITGGLNNLKFAAAPAADVHRDVRLIEQLPEHDPSPPLPFREEIRLEKVGFRYEGADTDALSDVDLVITRGESIGICGPTGGGKSTLVDLIIGLLRPTAGRVLVDGQDLAGRTRGWQANLGIVPQMVFLVDDTVAHNIALGVDDSDIDPDALTEAIRLAQLDEFVASLQDGLDTIVGERGVRVSGGERQRIAIARALYRRPQVLILDEGTSALDNLTEQELMLALKRLRGDHTILLVAHRLSTIVDSDRVVLVDNGRIADVGSFEEVEGRNPSLHTIATNP